MNKYFTMIILSLLVFSNSAFCNDVDEPKPTNKLIVAGAIITGIGLLGMAAKDSGGSRSSGFYEAQRASGIVVLAGISLIVMGKRRDTKLGISIQESQPVLSFAHRF
jgi:hypothetical protein